MSDLSVTINNAIDLIKGKISFSQFKAGEAALVTKDISRLPAILQPSATALLGSLETNLSASVGSGITGIGDLLAESSDDQATFLLNLLEKAGVPTGGAVLSIAEHAALVAIITGLKALLDRTGLKIVTAGAAPVSQPATAPQQAAGILARVG